MAELRYSRSSVGPQVYSRLLSSRENALLFNLLGPECSAVASAVAQVYMAPVEPGEQTATWKREGCGVVCLVKDQSLRSYFLRLYSLKRAKLLWEQELYAPFRYSAPRPFFHTFPADDCQAGLNFADEEEAETFFSAVETRIRRSQATEADFQSAQPQMTRTHSLDSSSHQLLKSRLSSSDIGFPSEFKHVTHVGWDPEKGFDVKNLDPALQELFMKAGISERDLQDRQISRVITGIIERQGGLEAMRKETQSTGPPPQTDPKPKGAITELGLKKGPLPPLPPHARKVPRVVTRSISVQSFSQESRRGPHLTLPLPFEIPPPPSFSPPAPPTTAPVPLPLHTLPPPPAATSSPPLKQDPDPLRKSLSPMGMQTLPSSSVMECLRHSVSPTMVSKLDHQSQVTDDQNRETSSTAEHSNIVSVLRDRMQQRQNTLQVTDDSSDGDSEGGEWL